MILDVCHSLVGCRQPSCVYGILEFRIWTSPEHLEQSDQLSKQFGVDLTISSCRTINDYKLQGDLYELIERQLLIGVLRVHRYASRLLISGYVHP